MAPHRGTMILVLGIVGFFCFLVAIAAWLMGKKDLAEMDAGRMDPAGRQNTKIGMILGIVFTILGAIGIVINILLRVMG
jgi:preprotein translocase subunit Sss1